MAPTSKSENLTVLFGPCKIDGDAWRLVMDKDGTRSEMWETGKGWVTSTGPGMPFEEFEDAPPVSKVLVASLGMPVSELQAHRPALSLRNGASV